MSGHPGGAAPHRDVLQQPTELFVARGTPAYLRSDNGPELTANAVREWLARVGVTLLFMEPGSPWENGYIESFNARRAPGPRALLHARRGPDPDGAVAAGVHPPPASQRARLPAARSRGHRSAAAAAQLCCPSRDADSNIGTGTTTGGGQIPSGWLCAGSSSPACRPASRRTWRRGKRRHGRHHRTDDARLRRMRGVDRLDGTGLEKGR